jgi:hypothetical protein
MLNIVEIGTVSERIMMLINHFSQGNKTAFGRAADIQSGVLAGIIGGRESKPGFEILQKLLTAYPTVNPKWLLFGQGKMLLKPVDDISHMSNDDEISRAIASQDGQVLLNATREELEVLRTKVSDHQLALMRRQEDTDELYVKIQRRLAHLDL